MRYALLIAVAAGIFLCGLPQVSAQVGIGLGNRSSNGSSVGFGVSGVRPLPPDKPKPPEVQPTGMGVRNFFKTSTAATSTSAAVTAENLTDAQLVAAIQRGIAYLLVQPHKANWERGNHGVAGSLVQGFDTASILYCLLQVGNAMHDKRLEADSKDISPALQWLARINPSYTDTVGLQACALAQAAEHPVYKAALTRVTNRLVAAIHADGGFGFWMQPGNTGLGWDAPPYPNGISSQLATLGTLLAADAGVPVPEKFWTASDQFWRKAQNTDGGWCYGMAGKDSPHDHHRPREDGSPQDQSNMALSAGGTALVKLLKQHLPSAYGAADLNLQHAQDYLAGHLDANNSRCLFELSYYRGTGLDALGLFSKNSRVEHLGEAEIIRPLAAALIRSQNTDGSWNTPGDPVGTAYAVLFLTRCHAIILNEKPASILKPGN